MNTIESKRRKFLGLGAAAGTMAVGAMAVPDRAHAATPGDYIDVGDYAVGNGVADDTSAIQAAIDDAVDPVSGNIKAVYFPPLRYLVSRLSFHPNGHYYSDQQTRRRYNRGTSYIQSVYGGPQPAFVVSGEPGNYGFGPRFSNLFFGRNAGTGVNFRVRDIHRGYFENCTFAGESVCLQLQADIVGAWHNHFLHCVFLGPNSVTNGVGVNISSTGQGPGANENWFTGCLFSGNNKSLTIGHASGSSFFQCEFSKAFVEDGVGSGSIELHSGAPETEFHGCRFEQNNAHPDANVVRCSAPGLKFFGGRFYSTTIPSDRYVHNSAPGQYSIGCKNIPDVLGGGQLPVANGDGAFVSREINCSTYDQTTMVGTTLIPTANLMTIEFNGRRIRNISGDGRNGMFLTILANDSGELEDNVGNLRLSKKSNAHLEVTDTITLVCRSGKWYETSRSHNKT